jgi:hypothetical protein
MFSEIFWSNFYTTLVGFILALAAICYKSKCKEIGFCCIKIVRDVELEEKEMEFVTTHPRKESIDGQI